MRKKNEKAIGCQTPFENCITPASTDSEQLHVKPKFLSLLEQAQILIYNNAILSGVEGAKFSDAIIWLRDVKKYINAYEK